MKPAGIDPRPANGALVTHGRYGTDEATWTGAVVEDPSGACLGRCSDGSVSFAVRWTDGRVGSANSRDVTTTDRPVVIEAAQGQLFGVAS